MRCGIDEAGLGPKVGSLFVVGVAVSGELRDVRDSKEVFRRSLRTYSRAEGVVLSALRGLGFRGDTVMDMWRWVFGRTSDLYEGLTLPVFSATVGNLPFKVHRLVAVEIPANHLRSHRFLKDASALADVALRLGCKRVISGLAGGVKYYGRFLPGWERFPEDGGVSYRKGEQEIRFVKGADVKWKEVALASIFAKYFREVHMLAVNRAVGLEGDIPPASGYPADPQTPELVRRLIKRGLLHLIR